jgi:hypothetical protein
MKHVLSVMGLQNHPGNPKLWTIAHEMAQKRKNDGFCSYLLCYKPIMPMKHVLSVMGLQNHPGNPKLWTIAHEMAQKRKIDGFCSYLLNI